MAPRAVDTCEDTSADVTAVVPVVAETIPDAAVTANDGEGEDEDGPSPVVDGEKFFFSADEPEKKKTKKTSEPSFQFSFPPALEKSITSISDFKRKLDDGFVDAIDKTPLGVKVSDSESVSTSTRTSANSDEEGERAANPALERKESSVAKAAKKAGVAVGGGALIGVGVVMIPTLPPPFASLTMLGGYALLGTEFEGPREVVKNARDKMRNIEDEEEDDEEEEEEETTEIEEEFKKGEPEKLLNQLPQTDAEYWGYTGEGVKDSAKKSKKKFGVKKSAKKLSKKYVLPALEKVCNTYERFEEKKKASKEGKDENENTEKKEEPSKEEEPSNSATGDDEDEFVDAQEDWVDVEDDNQEKNEEPLVADEDSFDDAVLVEM